MKRIFVNNVSKKFKKSFGGDTSLFNLISLFSKKENKKPVNALKNISFSVDSGEIIGIIGQNRSGKSTLLRTISGIYEPDSGKIETQGKIISLINLNVGMQDRLTLRDNVYLCGSLFGMSRKEIKSKFDSIVEFSDLKDFIDTQIYKFSEGMKQRLAFSIAIHCNPDILLLDEVFEVGDENFKKKSADKIKELVANGASVLLVSHDLDLVRKYCDKIMWLDKGEIKDLGNSNTLLSKYMKL